MGIVIIKSTHFSETFIRAIYIECIDKFPIYLQLIRVNEHCERWIFFWGGDTNS